MKRYGPASISWSRGVKIFHAKGRGRGRGGRGGVGLGLVVRARDRV
jgi:hypothetical protein